MRTSSTLLLLLAMGLIAGCGKNTEFAAADLRVHATQINDVSGTGQFAPYAAKDLYITADSASTNYLFIAKTDANGSALFQGLDLYATYHVYGYERPADGLHLYGSAQVTMAEATPVLELKLRPSDTSQNGFVLTVTNTSNIPLPNVSVCVSTSVLALVPTECTGAVYSGNTDPYGRISKLNVAGGTLHARLKSPLLYLDTVVAFEVASTGIARPHIAVATGAPTGLRLTCTDGSGAVIPMVTVCAFSSQLLVNADCSLAAFNGATNNQGRYENLAVPPGTYHVRFKNEDLGIEIVREYTVVGQQVLEDTVVVL